MLHGAPSPSSPGWTVEAPCVSVIIPNFNRASLIPETLRSLQDQSLKRWEAIIVDDGSTDSSLLTVQDFCRSDPRFRLLQRQTHTRGAPACRNIGLGFARAAYTVFLDSDDVLLPHCLAHRVGVMESSHDLDFAVYLTEHFAESLGDRRILWNVFTAEPDLHRFISLDPPWCIMGPVWRTDSIRKLGGFDESLPSFQDWDLHVRALSSGLRYRRIDNRDNFYRNGAPSHVAISAKSCTIPEHLASHERLFSSLFRRLQSAGFLDEDLTHRFGALFGWLAGRWRRIPDHAAGDRTWRVARDLGIVARRYYLEGLLIQRLERFTGGGFVARHLLRRWPTRLHATGSATFQKAPLPHALAKCRDEVADDTTSCV